jgi:diadenylate cyclase
MEKFKSYECMMHVAKRIARSKEGALLVIAPKASFAGTYDLMFPQVMKGKYVGEKGMEKVLEKLAVLDGAVLISDKGELIAYGAKLKHSSPLPGFGTKHAAASGTTSKLAGSTAILVSEEENWIKVFQDGKVILETDSEDNPKPLEHKIISFLTDGDTALLTAGGLSAAILGAPALAPIMVVGGTYLALKTARGFIKKNWSSIRGKK